MKRISEYPNKAGIYKLIGPDGKVYIGKTINLRVRLNKHKNYKTTCGVKSYLKNAILNYGWSSFSVELLEVLEHFDKSKDNDYLLLRESEYIDLYDSTNKDRGYNICKVSTDRTGVPISDDTRLKLRSARLGKKMSDETKEKLRKSRLGAIFSEEHKQKLRDAKLKNPMTEEHKEKLRTINTGKKMSDETKEKLRIARLGVIVSEETKEKNRRPCSEEKKEKIRRGNLGKKHSKESIEKMRIAKLGKRRKKNNNEIEKPL